MDDVLDEPEGAESVIEAMSPPRYPAGDFAEAIRRICAGRSVHVARAASIDHPEQLGLALEAGARRLILSDTSDHSTACAALAERLRDLHPESEIVVLTLDYADFWQCRSAPKSEVVMDLGSLIHDSAPDRMIQRLSLMTTDTLFIAAMVLPPFTDPADAAFPDGRILPAQRLRPPFAIAEGAALSFKRRGLALPQLDPGAVGPRAVPLFQGWRWFFSAAGLERLGNTLGLATTSAFYIWHDITIAIEFRRQ